MNICLCGTQAGYTHTSDCPYPMYRSDDYSMNKWDAARSAKWALSHPHHDEHDTYQTDEPGFNHDAFIHGRA